MKNFCEKYNVSRETFDKLKTYQELLLSWQQKFNLVGPATLEDAWNRHFLDSVQLFSLIPKDAEVLYDFGSGAGFPGMVLAIMANEKMPNLEINLVESTGKKTLYLNEVKEQTNTKVNIINERIEKISAQKADVITSRAMASLNDLLGYAIRFCQENTICIFPKGKKYAEELAEAHRHWKFKCQILPSEQSQEGRILVITKLSKIKGEK